MKQNDILIIRPKCRALRRPRALYNLLLNYAECDSGYSRRGGNPFQIRAAQNFREVEC